MKLTKAGFTAFGKPPRAIAVGLIAQ